MTDFLVELDVSIFRALNDFVGWNPTFDRILANHEILKGPLFAVIVGVLWYWPDKDMSRQRETLLMMMVVVGLSIVVHPVDASALSRSPDVQRRSQCTESRRLARELHAMEQLPERHRNVSVRNRGGPLDNIEVVGCVRPRQA